MASGIPVPRTTKPRPALPKVGNKLLRVAEALPPVKFQPIKKDGNVVIVGRVKIPTPSAVEGKQEHAYILRRYDTGYVSISTMWKGAFPTAAPTEEKEEIAWVKANFDCSLPAGTKEDMRLAGTWVPVDVARFLAPSYNLQHVITILVNARPDAETTAKALAQAPVESVNGNAHKSSATPNKRARKETSDTPIKVSSGTSVNGAIALLSTPGSTTKTRPKSKSPAPPASRSTPSRSAKTRKAPSPAPKAPSPAPGTPGTGPRRSARIPTLPQHWEDEEEEEEAYGVKGGKASRLPIPDPAEDIAESQSLVQHLMAQREKAAAPVTSAVKRTLEQADAPLTLNLDQPSQEVTYVPPSDRAVVTNRRILPQWPTLPQLDSNQKSVAWGTLAFAIGWGAAATILPQFF